MAVTKQEYAKELLDKFCEDDPSSADAVVNISKGIITDQGCEALDIMNNSIRYSGNGDLYIALNEYGLVDMDIVEHPNQYKLYYSKINGKTTQEVMNSLM